MLKFGSSNILWLCLTIQVPVRRWGVVWRDTEGGRQAAAVVAGLERWRVQGRVCVTPNRVGPLTI
jgi:hypothetical protein